MTTIRRTATIRRDHSNEFSDDRTFRAEWWRGARGGWRVSLELNGRVILEDGAGEDLQGFILGGGVTAKRRTLLRAYDALLPVAP